MRIIKSIIEGPKNANQLSKDMDVNYRTVEHHMKVLEANGLVTTQGDGYGKVYFPSPVILRNLDNLVKLLEDRGDKGGAQ